MSENGMCSEDEVIKKLRERISVAENEIALIISGLGHHCRVSGMSVVYNFSTCRNIKDATFMNGLSAGIHVELQYRIG